MAAASHPVDLLIRKLRQHSPLSDADCEEIKSLPFTIRTMSAHSHIVREGDGPAHCPVLMSGFAYRHKLTGEGARQIVAVHIPGEPLDLQNLFLDESDHNVQMLTDGELAFLSRPHLQDLARSNSDIGHAILVMTLIDSSIFREWVLNVGRRNSRARLAHLLCEFAARIEAQQLTNDYGYELPMTQDQLADALGLTPVHVNRTMKSLEAEGLITRDHPRHIKIPDWTLLRRAGDFHARYLHLQPQTTGLHLKGAPHGPN